jgi:hypothetical protein
MNAVHARKASAVAVALMLAAPAAANAKIVPVIPPGNSAANQYVEGVPTAKGSRPSSSITPVGGGGGGGAGGTSSGSSAVSPSTASSLTRQGPLGVLASAITRATAPAVVKGAPLAHRGNVTVTPSGSSTGSAQTTGAPAPHRSAASQVLAALSGSASHGGLGPLLPIILVTTLLAVAAIAMRRARSRDA